jgi:hypothetical protein
LKEEIQMAKKPHQKILTISTHIRNTNQNHTKIPPHPIRIANIQNTTTTCVGKDVGKKEPSYTAGGNAS